MKVQKSRRDILTSISALGVALVFGGVSLAQAASKKDNHGKGKGKSGGGGHDDGHDDISHDDGGHTDDGHDDSDHASGKRGPRYKGGKEVSPTTHGHGRSLEDRILRASAE